MPRVVSAVLILLLGTATASRGDDPLDSAPSYEDQAKIAVDKRIDLVNEQISAVEKRMHDKRNGETAATKRKHAAKIQRLKAEVKDLKAGKIEVLPVLEWPLMVGRIGVPKCDHAEVMQIVGPEEMLVDLVNYAERQGLPPLRREKTVLVRGVKTAGRADGARLDLPKLLRVMGNHTYDTPIGSTNTVMVLSPFTPPRLDGK